MTNLDRRRFSVSGRFVAAVPWPGSGLAVSLILVGVPLSFIGSLRDQFALRPSAVASGEWWRLLTGQIVQPPDWITALAAAAAAAVFAREIEQRSGSWRLWRFLGVAAIAIGVGWVCIQASARAIGMQSGWDVPLVGYPVVTALVAYRLVESPHARLAATGYYVPTWAGALAHAAATCTLLAWRPWPIYLPAHLLALVVGAVWGYVAQQSLARVIRQFAPAASGPADRLANERPLMDLGASSQRDADVELEGKLDRVLAKIAARGEDSLSAADRDFLLEAARRLRERRER